ncbi:DUF1007 family protein [Szabonella alba]|uniref:DUF1007 family protein n=1 Tax=Szabonella alba TaxID=2804194 RepID=A0A8K0V9S0_9RHOB|nr:DUF1007 family protein [Szabonella alba]MBL4915980.1 DUF1007 family protein [Szabonella alba]
MRFFQMVLVLALSLVPRIGAAHPHIFIDTEIEVIFDAEGRAEAVRVSWIYDDFFSLLMIEDRGLDSDGDGQLTEAEQTALQGFDMAWDADYEGDLFVLLNEQRLALGRPTDFTAHYDGAQITSTHLRRFETAVPPAQAPLILQVYDPGYYTAYTITGQPVLTDPPAGCSAQVYEPDRDAANEQLEAMLKEYSAQQDLEMDFPAVGAAYADEVRVTCPGA